MNLPFDIRNRIEESVNDIPFRALKDRSKDITFNYKSNIGSGKRLLVDKLGVKVYSIVRFPATYSAIYQSLIWTFQNSGISIDNVLDVGAGIGTASIAVSYFFPYINNFTLVEREPEMIKFGKQISQEFFINKSFNWINGDINHYEFNSNYDLVILSYSFNEFGESDRQKLIKKLWEITNKVLLIVEPGTPKNFSNLRIIRKMLVDGGANILAPCPSNSDCMLDLNDWCSFSTRVERSKLHKMLKGAEVPYEDENFCFFAFSKLKPQTYVRRVIRHPKIESGKVTLKLCSKEGISSQVVTKRSKDYKKARKIISGDNFA